MAPAPPDRVVWLGHATVLVELDGARVLTDPVLGPRLAHLRRHAPLPELGPAPIDAVLLSHLHLDHADGRSLRSLAPAVEVLVPAGAATTVRRFGVRRVREVGTGDAVDIAPGVTARAVPARHDGHRTRWGTQAEAIGWV